METELDPRFEIFFTDSNLQEVFRSIGAFVLDYTKQRGFPNEFWPDSVPAEGNVGKLYEWLRFVHPDDRDRVYRATKALYLGETREFQQIYRFLIRENQYRWILNRGRGVGSSSDGSPLLYIAIDTDITHLKEMESQLQQQNDEIELLRDVVKVVSASLDLEKTVQTILEQTRRLIPYDAATVQVLRPGKLKVIGSYGLSGSPNPLELQFPYPEEGSLSTKAIDDRAPVLSRDISRDFPNFIQPTTDFVTRSWIGVPLIRGQQVIGILSAYGLTPNQFETRHGVLGATIAEHLGLSLENAQLHSKTLGMAMTDHLTRVGSRHRLHLDGRFLVEHAQKHHQPLSLLMIDLDHFKAVNDDFGHLLGDQVLSSLPREWIKELRDTDLLTRFGGEEFVIILPDTPGEEAVLVAQRILECTRGYSKLPIPRGITVSIGIATLPEGAENTLETLLSSADRALYESKNKGRNQLTWN